MHNNAHSWLQFADDSDYCCSELCPLHVPSCSTLKKARFALWGHTRMCSLLSRSTDVKDQLTGEAMTWDLMTFVCTTLTRLLHSSFLSYLPEINKHSEVSVKLESERSWKPTSCASSQLQRMRLFSSSFWNTESCGYGLQLFLWSQVFRLL